MSNRERIGWWCGLGVLLVCALLWTHHISDRHTRIIAVCETKGGYLVYDAKAVGVKTLCLDKTQIKELD